MALLTLALSPLDIALWSIQGLKNCWGYLSMDTCFGATNLKEACDTSHLRLCDSKNGIFLGTNAFVPRNLGSKRPPQEA